MREERQDRERIDPIDDFRNLVAAVVGFAIIYFWMFR